MDLDWKISGVGLLVETLQLIGLTLNPNLHWGPVLGTTVSSIVYFFNLPLFDPKWATNTYIAEAVFFWVFVVVLAAWVGIVGSYTLYEFHTMPRYLIHFTRTVLHAVTSFALIPVAMTFCCYLVSARGTGGEQPVLFWFGQRYPYLSGYAGAAFAFGIIGLLLLCALTAAGTAFVYDDMPNSANLSARAGGGMTWLTAMAKLTSVLLYHALISQGYPQPYAATLCAMYGLLAIGYMVLLPYYNLRMNQFRAGQMLVTAVFAGVAALNVRTDMAWHDKSISTVVVLVLAVGGFLVGWFVALARVNPLYLISGREHLMRRRGRQQLSPPLSHSSTENGAEVRNSGEEGHRGSTEHHSHRGSGGHGRRATDTRVFPRHLPATDLVFTAYPGLESILLHPLGASSAEGSGSPGQSGTSYDSDSAEGREMASRGDRATLLAGADGLGADEEAAAGLLLDPYLTAVHTAADVELATRFLRAHVRRSGSRVVALPPPLCAYAARIYIKGMVKYPDSLEVRYHFCLFLAVYAKRLRMGLGELNALQRTREGVMSLPLRFRVYRLRERIKQVLEVGNTQQSQLIALATEAHREVLAGMSTFWDYLTTSHAADHLAQIADYISAKREECRGLYSKSLQCPDETVLTNYSRFLRDVILDVDSAEALRTLLVEESNMHTQQQAARLAVVHGGTDGGEDGADSGLPGAGQSALEGAGGGVSAALVPTGVPDGTADMAVGTLVAAAKTQAASVRWHACRQLIDSREKLGTVSLTLGDGRPGQGHFSRSAREIRALRVAVYAVILLVVGIALGLAVFAAVRIEALRTATDRILAASQERLYFSLGALIVGQIAFLERAGLPDAEVEEKLVYLREQLGRCAEVIRTSHERLTRDSLFTEDTIISRFFNDPRTEMVEIGIPSIEGPNSRVMTDLYSLGTRIANTFATLSARPETVQNYQTHVAFVTVNAQQHTFTRALNRSVELYVNQRVDYLNSSIWAATVLVSVGIFLLLVVYAMIQIYLHRIAQARSAAIHLFALIPRSYAEELRTRSRARLWAFTQETDPDPAAAGQAGGRRAGRDAHSRPTAAGTAPVLDRHASSARRAHGGRRSTVNGAHDASLAHGTAHAEPPPAAEAGTSFGTRTLRVSRRASSISGAPRAGYGDFAEESATRGEYSVKHIADGDTSESGLRTHAEDPVRPSPLDPSSSGGGGASRGGAGKGGLGSDSNSSSCSDPGATAGEATVCAFETITRHLASPIVVIAILCSCIALSAAGLGLSLSLKRTAVSVEDESIAASDFESLLGSLMDHMAWQGRNAQQYVITGDLVHVERYSNFARQYDHEQLLDRAIVMEPNTATVTALVEIRALLRSAWKRQQIAMWLASLYYNVSEEHAYLFARVNAARPLYDFATMQAAARTLFADYRPVAATPTASTPEVDAALPKDIQFRVARHVVFDDYYQAHRFKLVDYLEWAKRTHVGDYAGVVTTQQRLWVTSVVVESVLIVLLGVAVLAHLWSKGPRMACVGLVVSGALGVASVSVLGITRAPMTRAILLSDDYRRYIMARNDSISTLGSTQDYALRIQQMGYESAVAEWTQNRVAGAFHQSLTLMVTSMLSSITRGAVAATTGWTEALYLSVEQLAYLSDVCAAISIKAYNHSVPPPLTHFQYNRELEGMYEPDFFRFGNPPNLYVSTTADAGKTMEKQLAMALMAASGARFEYVASGAYNTFSTTALRIGELIAAQLGSTREKVQHLTEVSVALAGALIAVCVLTTLYAMLAAAMRETEQLTSTMRAAAAAGHADRAARAERQQLRPGGLPEGGQGAFATGRAASRRQRTQAVLLLAVTLTAVGLLVGLLVVSHQTNTQELEISRMLNRIKARDWVLIDALIQAQHVWRETTDPSLVSPYLLDLSRALNTAIQERMELYLGNGKHFTGVLTQSGRQTNALFGSSVYEWAAYQGVCTPFVRPVGAALVDYPQLNGSTVSESDMRKNTFAYGVENVVWQITGALVTMLQAPSTREAGRYESPLIALFPSVAERLRASTEKVLEDRSAAAASLVVIFIALAVLLMFVLAVGLVTVVRPIMDFLAKEEESTCLMLRMIPESVRRDVPAITEFFTTGSVNKDAEIISNGCRDLQSTALVVVAEDDTILSATEEALRQFQRSADEVVGARLEVLLSRDSGAEFARARAELGRSRLAALAGTEVRTVGRRSDGTLFPVSARVREVFATAAPTRKQGFWGWLSRAAGGFAAGDTSVFVVRFIDLGVRSDLEIIRQMQSTLFDGCRQPQVVMDATGHIRMVNRAALQLFGRTADAMVRAQLSSLLQADCARDLARALKDLLAKSRVLNTGVTVSLRVTALVRDSARVHLEAQMTTVMSHDAEVHRTPPSAGRKGVIAIVTHLRDVSQDLYVQQADLASKAIMDLSPVPVIVFDESSRVLSFSMAAEKSWGCRADTVIGCPLNLLLAPPEDGGSGYDLSFGQHSDLKHFLSGPKTLTGRRRDNGESFLIEVLVRELMRTDEGKGGRPAATFMGFFRDLTSETTLATRNMVSHAVFDSCPTPIIVADDYGRILVVNPAAERVFGYGPGELTGKDVSVLMPEHIAQRHAMLLKRYRDTGEESFVNAKPRSEFARRADGRLFTVEISLRGMTVSDLMEDYQTPIEAVTGVSPAQPTGARGRRRIAAYVRDTSHELRASRANSMHEAIIRHSPVPMMSVNEDGLMEYVNPALAALVQYDAAGLVGRHAASTLFPDGDSGADLGELGPLAAEPLHEVGRQGEGEGRDGGGAGSESCRAVRETFGTLLEAARDGPATAVLTARDAGGRSFPLQLSVHELEQGEEAFDHLHLPRLFVVSVRDIARLTEVDADTYLERALVAAYPGSVLVMTERGAVRYLSEQARRFFGLPDSASPTGLHVSSLFVSTTQGAAAGGSCAGPGEGKDDSDRDSHWASPTTATGSGRGELLTVTEELIAAATNGPGPSVRGSLASSPGYHGTSTVAMKRESHGRLAAAKAAAAAAAAATAAVGPDRPEEEGVLLRCVQADGLTGPVVVRVRRMRGAAREGALRGPAHPRTEHPSAAEAMVGGSAGSSSGGMGHTLTRPTSSLRTDGSAGPASGLSSTRPPGEEALYVLLIRDPVEDNAAEQSTAMKNAILDQLSLGAVQVDAEGTMLSVNRAFLEIFRYPAASDVTGRNIALLAPTSAAPDSDAGVGGVRSGTGGDVGGPRAGARPTAASDKEGSISMDRLKQLMAAAHSEPGAGCEFLAVRADGTPVYVAVTVGEALSAAGKSPQAGGTAAGSCFLFIRDIGLAVQTRNRQRLLTDLLTTAPVATLIVEGVSASGSIRLFNEAARRLFERTQEEAIREGIDALLTVGGQRVTDVHAAQHAGQSSTTWTASGRRPDGSTFPATVHVANFFYEETKEDCLLLLVEDVTAQVMFECECAASRAIEDATPYAIICFDEAREVLLFSKQAETLFQCQEADMIGRSIHSLVSEQTAVLFDAIVADVIATGSTAMRTTPRKAYRQVAKRLGATGSSGENVFPSEWVFYELTPQTSPDHEAAADSDGTRGAGADRHVFVALVRDTSSATSDAIAGAISTAAINALSIPFISFCDVGVIKMANSAVASLLGYESSSELLGHNIRMLLGPDVASRLTASMKTFRDQQQQPQRGYITADGRSQVVYITGKRKSGESVSLELMLGMLPPPEGAAATVCEGDSVKLARSTVASLGVTWYGFLYEVGEKVSMKKQLAFNETIATMEGLAVLLVNHQGIITYAGDSARQMFGSQPRERPETELEGRPLSIILKKADPFGAFVAECEALATASAAASGAAGPQPTRPRSISMVGCRLDREAPVPCRVQLTRASSGDSDASYTCLITSSVDREAAENSAQLMEAANGLSMMPVIVCNERGIIRYVNEQTLALFRYSRPEEMVGHEVGLIMSPAEAAAHKDHLDNYLRGFKRNSTVIGRTRRVMGIRRDNTTVAINVSVDETVTASGAHHFVAYIEDLTSSVRTEGALRVVNSVLASVPDVVFVVSGTDGKILQMSGVSLEKLRLSEEQATEHPLMEFLAVPSPEDGTPTTGEANRAALLSPGTKPVVILPSAGGSPRGDVRTTLQVSHLDGVDGVSILLCLLADW